MGKRMVYPGPEDKLVVSTDDGYRSLLKGVVYDVPGVHVLSVRQQGVEPAGPDGPPAKPLPEPD